jgi:hypothetical protein
MPLVPGWILDTRKMHSSRIVIYAEADLNSTAGAADEDSERECFPTIVPTKCYVYSDFGRLGRLSMSL